MNDTIKIQRYKDLVKEFCGCSPDMMVENFYQKIGNQIFQKREKIRDSIKTISQWEKEKLKIKRNLTVAIGSEFPKTQVKVIEKGEIKKKGFRVKKILFSLHKDHWVPSLIYIPEGKGPFPGMLIPAGHDINGKFAYNEMAVFYALNGYVAITYDFVGQGERCLKDEDGYVYAFSSTAHNVIGVPMTLYGYNLNWFTIFESIAAIGVLKQTGIVDMSKVGITGASGGGTNAFYTAAADERVAATAPAASVHSFKNYVYPDDSEQSFFNHIEAGLDYADVASFLIAPRPMFIVANKHDIWDIEGTKYVYESAKKFYMMHNAEDKLKISVSEQGHCYNSKQQTEVLKWFNEIFGNKTQFFPLEKIDKKNLPSDDELCVLPDRMSQRFYLKNFLVVFKKNIGIMKKDNSFVENIRQYLLPFTFKNFYLKNIGRYPTGKLNHCRMVFSPEKGLLLPAEVIVPEKPKQAIILLDEVGRIQNCQWQFEYAYKNYLVIKPDLRGTGETSMKDNWQDIENWCQNIFSGKNFKLFILCHLVGKSIVVERAKDILCLVSIINKNFKIKNVFVHARGIMALPAIIASIVDSRIEKLMLEEFLYSFRSVFEKDYPVWKPDAYFYGTLKAGFDINDLCSISRAKKIEFRKPLDGLMKPVF
ncbi:MAG: acetylxylan esterase [Candidatus Omnitrophica bacterium]|nr:acetylxylan esterase [Candidatus Omnitrophota bacterium]